MDNPSVPLAVVTGAGRRLGRVLARTLAAEGYDLALSAHRSVEPAQELAAEIVASGRRAKVFAADLSDRDAVSALAARVVDAMGPPTLLVNNAGVIGSRGPEDRDASELDLAHAVNVRAPYILSLALATPMASRSGSVVNIASVGGLRPYRRHPAYSISKAALVMQTRALARRLAPGVRVNAVAPGTLWLPGEEEESVAKPDRSKIPLGRYGEAHHVAAAVVYLARATWVTGAVFPVDGGASLG